MQTKDQVQQELNNLYAIYRQVTEEHRAAFRQNNPFAHQSAGYHLNIQLKRLMPEINRLEEKLKAFK